MFEMSRNLLARSGALLKLGVINKSLLIFCTTLLISAGEGFGVLLKDTSAGRGGVSKVSVSESKTTCSAVSFPSSQSHSSVLILPFIPHLPHLSLSCLP